jgi:hypothetical protein
MKNVEMKMEDNILIVKVDLTKEFGPSASGKLLSLPQRKGIFLFLTRKTSRSD